MKALDSDKNLHASIPAMLLARAKKVARQDHISFDELVSDALERYIEKRRELNEQMELPHADAHRHRRGSVAFYKPEP